MLKSRKNLNNYTCPWVSHYSFCDIIILLFLCTLSWGLGWFFCLLFIKFCLGFIAGAFLGVFSITIKSSQNTLGLNDYVSENDYLFKENNEMSQTELNLCNFQPLKPFAYGVPVPFIADAESSKPIMPLPYTTYSSLSASVYSPPEGRRWRINSQSEAEATSVWPK